MTAPRVTIGLPVYNGERHLRESIESILAQTYQDFELIIGDNGSTDGSGAICRGFAASDHRIRYHRHARNLGAARNHNWLVGQARGDLFKWASDDDILAPTFLERLVAALDDCPEASLAFPRTRVIDSEGETVTDLGRWGIGDSASDEPAMSVHSSPSDRLITVLREHDVAPCFGLMRTAVMRLTRLNESYLSSDRPFLAEMAMAGRFAEVDELLFLRRWPGGKRGPRAATDSRREIAEWFEPGLGRRYPLHQTKVFHGYVRAVREARIAPRERVRCFVAVMGWLRRDRRWRVIGGECRMHVRELLARRRSEPPFDATATGSPAHRRR